MTAGGRVDVVIPAYNASRFIVAALRSVVAQAPHVASVIVVDDGSTDDTALLVKAFAADCPEGLIRCITQPNAGTAAARNTGLGLAQAEFVALLDADDIWKPGKLTAQLERFDHPAFPNLGVVYCDYDLMTEDGQPLPNCGFRLNRRIRGNVERRLLRANLIAGSASAVLIRRSCLDQVGLFDPSLICAEDWDLWLRLAGTYAYDYAAEEMVTLRRHSSSWQNNRRQMVSSEMLFVNKLHKLGKARWFHYVRLERQLVCEGIDAASLRGFADCDPAFRRIFYGWAMRACAAAFRVGYRLRDLARWVGRSIRTRRSQK